MTRRTGNNYSGPRWLYSTGERRVPKPKRCRKGVTLMGGSNRQTEKVVTECDCPECESV